jgi:hypothetical protein
MAWPRGAHQGDSPAMATKTGPRLAQGRGPLLEGTSSPVGMARRAMVIRRSSHSVWDCGYHLVWATKRRRRALAQEEERAYCERLLRRAKGPRGVSPTVSFPTRRTKNVCPAGGGRLRPETPRHLFTRSPVHPVTCSPASARPGKRACGKPQAPTTAMDPT